MDFIIYNQIAKCYGPVSHAGDTVLTRPIILAIKNNFPELNITLQFNKKYHYLFQDLGFPIKEDEEIKGHSYNAWFGCHNDILLTHGMTYLNQLCSFNRQMETQHLSLRLPQKEEHPMLNFPPDELLPIIQNGILIENGPCFTNQTCIDINSLIPKLVNDFKEYNFYTSADSINASNLHSCKEENLIRISNLSNLCLALITRGSGVNAACYTEKNKNKKRAFIGWTCSYRLWDNKFINCISYDDLYAFMKSLKG